MVENAIITTIQKYLAALAPAGIHASKAVLFGSFAKGSANAWSDIDLVVIAPEFDEQKKLRLIETLWQTTIIDSRIEPIPCGEKEWLTDQSRPILEIARQEGLVVTAAN